MHAQNQKAIITAKLRGVNAMAAAADAVLVIGSTLSVYPAAFVPLDVVSAGHPMVIVNLGPTDHDQLATTVVEAPAGEAVPAIAAALGA